MKRKILTIFIALFVVVLFVSGCTEQSTNQDDNESNGTNEEIDDYDSDGYNDDVDDFPKDSNLYLKDLLKEKTMTYEWNYTKYGYSDTKSPDSDAKYLLVECSTESNEPYINPIGITVSYKSTTDKEFTKSVYIKQGYDATMMIPFEIEISGNLNVKIGSVDDIQEIGQNGTVSYAVYQLK